MCCLFGVLDYNHSLSKRQMNRILNVLSTACEVRGTDATGIAYNHNGKLRIYKRPIPAHLMRFNVPDGVNAVMGHTRMTTQGSEKLNFNNHPFYGKADVPFALAHNGVIYNDERVRENEHLPNTHIKTDSYIAVQLIENKKRLDFDSLKYMAEQLQGSMTITVMDIESGEILKIGSSGYRTRSQFDNSGLYYSYYFPYRHGWDDDWWTSSKTNSVKMDPSNTLRISRVSPAIVGICPKTLKNYMKMGTRWTR